MKKDVLERAYNDQILIGLRLETEDWDEVTIGFVIELGDEYVVLNEIDENGQLAGKTLVELDSIISIDINDRYQKRLKCIFDHSSELNFNKQVSILKSGDRLTPYFDKLISSKTIVTLMFNEEFYVTGLIKNYDDNYILINDIGREGDDDGESFYRIGDLIGLRYSGIIEQKIALLYKNRNSFYEL